jgi:lambda family phage tail tape measure protein
VKKRLICTRLLTRVALNGLLSKPTKSEHRPQLARWTSQADDNVKKQRDQVEALKQLTEAARKFRDEATTATDTAGLSDRQKQRFEEIQQVDRVFAKLTAALPQLPKNGRSRCAG